MAVAGELVSVAVLDAAASGAAGADGRCELRPSLPPMSWDALRIGRMTVTAPNASPAPRCFVYVDEERPENLLDSSADARTDIADEASPIYITAGGVLLVIFDQVAPNGVCTVRLNGDVLVRAG